MPYLFRLGGAVVAVTAIAALAAIGLYSVVAGGLLFGSPGPRPATVVPPVLVTIQAAPVTPTPIPIPTSTPMPSSLIPGLGPPGLLLAPPSTVSPGALIAPTPMFAVSPAASPDMAGSPRPLPPRQTDEGRRAVHDGLTLEIVEAHRGWQPRISDETAARGRDAQEVLAIDVRLVNQTDSLRYVADLDLILVADDGARVPPRQAPPFREPRLLTVPVPPGDTIRGWLTYDAPAGEGPRRLQWSPTRPDRPRAEAAYLLALP